MATLNPIHRDLGTIPRIRALPRSAIHALRSDR